MDIPFLNTLGISVQGLSSSSIRLFGNGGAMLPEANNGSRPDDLTENDLFVEDGGDGILNNADYILFYAEGPDKWVKDSVNRIFRHQKNLYSDSAYYFLSVGGTGSRIKTATISSPATVNVRSFNERYFHELDTVNFLSSGKQWYGEEFSDLPGKSLTRSFSPPVSLLNTEPVILVSDAVARSVNAPARLEVLVNNQLVQQLNIAATGSGAYDQFAKEAVEKSSFPLPQGNLSLTYRYSSNSFNSQAWLDWYELHGRKQLEVTTPEQLSFRDWNSVQANPIEFVISTPLAQIRVWEVTDPLHPVLMQGVFSNNEYRFSNDGSRLREYVAFSTNFPVPVSLGKIPGQNLHKLTTADLLIITHKSLETQAGRLANYHRQRDNMVVEVVEINQVYNEFASGNPDPVAIRDFVKMLYDRARAANTSPPRYLALFGDASFDYKYRVNHNTNLVPAYQNSNALDPLSTYTSDDFFGYLDDNEDINASGILNLLDIGIGRIPAGTVEEAKNYIDKLTAYHDAESFGPWRNNLCFIADDEDQNLHLNDAEQITRTVSATNDLFNVQKIYLDAFEEKSGSGGQTFPGVNEQVNNRILDGVLVFNYNGHGSAGRLAEEVVLDQSIVNAWKNKKKLPLFITATCDFAPYDNPLVHSIGEDILLRPETGGIALMTTTRLVFAFSNRIMNDNYLRFALKPDTTGNYLTLGEAVQAAKNYTYQTSGDIVNNRKFTLLGDPALKLGFPAFTVRTETINGLPASQPDTISAGEKVLIGGAITDHSGSVVNGFNGTVYVSVFDKPSEEFTLGNDPSSIVTGFQQRDKVIFRGKATVANGLFSTEFIVPKDLSYQAGNGKISYYAENGTSEAGGFYADLLTGGNASAGDNDQQGPEIKAWLNDEKFVNGSITNSKPLLILRLTDSSGINTLGTALGHDIIATIDGDENNFFVLNNYYEADQDNYRSGILRFQLPEFAAGNHAVRIKAWDVLNNSSEKELQFVVVEESELVVKRVYNYPNPFTTKTTFWFEHNRPGQELDVHIQIFTISGKIIKTISATINTEGNRSCEIDWNGRDEFGAKVARGVYLYKLTVRTSGLKPKTVIQKLVIF